MKKKKEIEPFSTDPDILTSWYTNCYGGNAGNCHTICRLILALAEAKGYVRTGEGYLTKFTYRTSEIQNSSDDGICGC